jgi:antitoxin HicB
MLDYPITLTKDTNGTLLVGSPDFPELVTFGQDKEDAIHHARDAFITAIGFRMKDRADVPPPSTKGRTRVSLPALVVFKVALYRQMKAQGVGRAELARRLGWKLEQVARVLDPYHESKMSNMEMAFKAIGLEVDAKLRKAS